MSRLDEYEALRKRSRRFLEMSPELGDAFWPYYRESYKPGALDAKTKRLIALCGGLVAGCFGCIVGQTRMALEEGASREEILETCAVAMSLGGTLAWSQVSLVMEFLEENQPEA